MFQDSRVITPLICHFQSAGCAQSNPVSPKRFACILRDRNRHEPWIIAPASPDLTPASRSTIGSAEVRRDRELALVGHDLPARIRDRLNDFRTSRFRTIPAVHLIVLGINVESAIRVLGPARPVIVRVGSCRNQKSLLIFHGAHIGCFRNPAKVHLDRKFIDHPHALIGILRGIPKLENATKSIIIRSGKPRDRAAKIRHLERFPFTHRALYPIRRGRLTRTIRTARAIHATRTIIGNCYDLILCERADRGPVLMHAISAIHTPNHHPIIRGGKNTNANNGLFHQE